MMLTLTSTYLALWGSLALCEPSNRNLQGNRMSDYASEDVDSLRTIVEYCGGTEHAVFLAGLADRMEQVIVEAQPVFTQMDIVMHREAAEACETSGQTIGSGSLRWWHMSMADRIERTLPTAVLESA